MGEPRETAARENNNSIRNAFGPGGAGLGRLTMIATPAPFATTSRSSGIVNISVFIIVTVLTILDIVIVIVIIIQQQPTKLKVSFAFWCGVPPVPHIQC